MQHNDNFHVGESDDSDDLDFEQKINQNKEIIKMHKLKKENEKINNSQRIKNPHDERVKK